MSEHTAEESLADWLEDQGTAGGSAWNERIKLSASMIRSLTKERDELRTRAVAMLNLLDDIYDDRITYEELENRCESFLNDSAWVDETNEVQP